MRKEYLDMTKEKQLISSILGPVRGDTRPFVYAVWRAEQVMFYENISMDDILITKDIYPDVAKATKRSLRTAMRQVERMSNRCFDSMDSEQKQKYIGKVIEELPTPRQMVYYLAFYSHFGMSYYEVIEEHPEILF